MRIAHMFQGKTIAEIRSMLAEGETTNDEVVAELESRHAKRLAKGKGSTWPARVLYRELTGKELPGTKLLNAKPKASEPKAKPAKAAKQPAAPAPVAGVSKADLARYAKASEKQLANWLRRADPNGPKAQAMQAELDRRTAKPEASTGDPIERARDALAGLDKQQLVALLESLAQ